MADFAAQIRAFRDKTLGTVDMIVQEATVEISAQLVGRTPIDTTSLRANWQFTEGEPGTEADYAHFDESPGGSETSQALAEQIRGVPAGSVTYVVNNLEYVKMLEYGLYTDRTGGRRSSGKTINGFSTQAPAGWIKNTAIEWPNFVKTAIAKVLT